MLLHRAGQGVDVFRPLVTGKARPALECGAGGGNGLVDVFAAGGRQAGDDVSACRLDHVEARTRRPVR